MRSTLGLTLFAFAFACLALAATFWIMTGVEANKACRDDPTLIDSCDAREDNIFRYSETGWFLFFASLAVVGVGTWAWLRDAKRRDPDALPALPKMDAQP